MAKVNASTFNNFGDLAPVFVAMATINSGAQESGVVSVGSLRIVGIATSGAITGTTASFKANSAIATANYCAVYDEFGTLKSVVLGTSTYTVLQVADFLGVNDLKVVMGTAQATTTDVSLLLMR